MTYSLFEMAKEKVDELIVDAPPPVPVGARLCEVLVLTRMLCIIIIGSKGRAETSC